MRFPIPPPPPKVHRPDELSVQADGSTDWASMNASEAIAHVAETTDRSTLLEYLNQEQSRTRPRKTVMSAISGALEE